MTTAAVGVRPAYSPRMWVYCVATIAAVAVIAEHLRSHFARGSVGHDRMAGMPGMAGVPETHTAAMSLAWLWMWWVVMTAAMMLPLAAGEADRIAAASLWGRRHVAVIEHLAGYLAVWSVFGLAAIWVVDVVWPSGVPAAAPVLALLSAAMWQVTGLRKRAFRRCGRSTYINVRGWRADRDCVIAGVSYGRRCLITSGDGGDGVGAQRLTDGGAGNLAFYRTSPRAESRAAGGAAAGGRLAGWDGCRARLVECPRAGSSAIATAGRFGAHRSARKGLASCAPDDRDRPPHDAQSGILG